MIGEVKEEMIGEEREGMIGEGKEEMIGLHVVGISVLASTAADLSKVRVTRNRLEMLR